MRKGWITVLLYCLPLVSTIAGCAHLFPDGQELQGDVEGSPGSKEPGEKPVKTVLDARRYKLVLPREIPEMGYVKFFRTGLEEYSPSVKVYQVHYGSKKLLGEITNTRPLCINIREGFTMFLLIAENGLTDREIIKVNTDKIKPMEVKFAWDAGYRYSHNFPYRWDIFDKHRYIDFDPKECSPVLVQ